PIASKIEGYNSKLKRYVVVSHPNIFAAGEALQKEEVSGGVNYHRA
ncbi:unnamed protein product, partial [Brachionus calyciflorus]